MAGKSDLESRRTAAQMHALTSVRREVRSRDSANGRKYLRAFTDAFQQYDSVLSYDQLHEKIAAAGTLLIGDYHALAASQRFVTELIERISQTRRVVLGLEAVLSRDQRILDKWWRREIAETELRQRLRFDREWGYDWPPLYELLSSARDHSEAIYGLDCEPRNDLRRIRSRDRHAVAKICQMRQEHSEALVIVLFGESHMAPQHLPRLLRESLPEERTLCVLQNVDALYWQAVAEHAAAATVGENAICVFNSTPLEKYESYRLCFERWNNSADDAPDFAPAVYNLISSLARSLGFRLNSPRNGTQPKFLSDSLPEVVSVSDSVLPELSDEDAVRLENQGCAYVGATNTFVVREFQVLHAARESARFLYHVCQGMMETSVHAKPIEEALANFGANLLCPTVGNESASLSDPGQLLYHSYIRGRLRRAAIRQLFLIHLDTEEAAARSLGTIVGSRCDS
jgi:Haem-binding uptake, Tiki superfamily, ChaN